MTKLRGWGSLLAIALPLLLWFVWSQLGAQTSRVELERYGDWQSRSMPAFVRNLAQFYLKNKRIARSEDVALPEVPPNSGIRSWSIQPDTTVVINLDASISGRPIRLHLVPVVETENWINYECVSEPPSLQLRNLCYTATIQSVADIPSQLVANSQVIKNLPDIVTSTGDRLSPGTPIGSVLVVPEDPLDLRHCGYQCVKLKKCTATRQIACSKNISEGGKRWTAIEPSGTQVAGSAIATRSEASNICEQALGAGFQILAATSVSGRINLDGGYEYWVHDDLRRENNCWSAD